MSDGFIRFQMHSKSLKHEFSNSKHIASNAKWILNTLYIDITCLNMCLNTQVERVQARVKYIVNMCCMPLARV